MLPESVKLFHGTIKEKEFAAKLGEAQSSAKSGTKNLKSSNPKGSLLRQRRTGAAGGRGVWGEFRPPYKFWAKSVRIFSKAHRQDWENIIGAG